jgi:ankyrin repeat protein
VNDVDYYSRYWDRSIRTKRYLGTSRTEMPRPFFDACADGDAALVEQYLVAGQACANDYHDCYEAGMPILVANGNLDVIKVLLKHGADIEQMDVYGKSPLHHACESHELQLETVRFLLDHGANVNFRSSPKLDFVEYNVTPLHSAMDNWQEGCEEIVRLLLDRGADIDSKDSEKQSPLFLACRNQYHLGVVKLLLERGANVNHKTKVGGTPLFAAIESALTDRHAITAINEESIELVDLLLSHGARLPYFNMGMDDEQLWSDEEEEKESDYNWEDYMNRNSFAINLAHLCYSRIQQHQFVPQLKEGRVRSAFAAINEQLGKHTNEDPISSSVLLNTIRTQFFHSFQVHNF